MDRSRWLAFGGLLAVVFIASVAAGAWIGRQRSVADEPVAAVATPTPSLSPTRVASPGLPTPRPTAMPTPTPILAPSPTVEPTVAMDPATAEEFAAELLAAIQTGDTQYLADRLHPIVLERYGEQQCQTRVDGFGADASAEWTVVSSSGPAPWSWETDNVARTIDAAWTVTVNEPGTGNRDLHFAPSSGDWRWFLDCGDPIGGG